MKNVRSARGQVVDFDLLAIKAQLSAKPAPKKVIERRDVIEQKESIQPEMNDMLAMAIEAAAESEKSAPKRK
jgi:hypothetical protein